MIPTRGQIKAQALGLLDDDAGKIFTETVFATAFQQAYDELFQGLLTGQCPAIKNIVVYTLPANTTSLTPAAAGISDFADLVKLREKLSGSSELFRQLDPREELTQRPPIDRLLEFVWRKNTFYFIGATSIRDLEITYESSGTAPTSDGTSIDVDGCLSVMSNFCAGIMGRRKGYDEIAAACMNFAVGPKYDEGTMGGAMFRLIQAKVRSEQKTPVAPRRFSSFRPLGLRRQGPFVAAQTPGGGATAPIQFSYSAGTVTGTLDGANAQFFLAFPVSGVVVALNGSTLTPTQHYTFGVNVITFIAPYIPQPGADILVEAWV